MRGIDSQTGIGIGGMPHLRQSIRDILSTPIGSRVLRRDYGSRLLELVDRPYSSSLRLQLIAATAEAIAAWEPRISLVSVSVSQFGAGRLEVSMIASLVASEQVLEIEGIVVS
ncbi:GPW/gp25 family protein [Loktanella salsilacus]|uniref:GPW/gp25 family protein n=1 Tax=Loktanella salsilacus TaxID=195913 RepID=UPI003703BF79